MGMAWRSVLIWSGFTSFKSLLLPNPTCLWQFVTFQDFAYLGKFCLSTTLHELSYCCNQSVFWNREKWLSFHNDFVIDEYQVISLTQNSWRAIRDSHKSRQNILSTSPRLLFVSCFSWIPKTYLSQPEFIHNKVVSRVIFQSSFNHFHIFYISTAHSSYTTPFFDELVAGDTFFYTGKEIHFQTKR